MRLLPLIALVAACEPSPVAPCSEEAEPSLEVTPSTVPFGEFVDGGELEFGPPPQGGAPYAAIDARVAGLAGMDDGVLLELSMVDLDTEESLGEVSYPTRLVCANVGDSAGTWLASDVHHRFYGFSLEDLPERYVAFTMRVTDGEDTVVEDGFEATLVPMD